MEINELKGLLGLAKTQLDKADSILSVLNRTTLTVTDEGVEEGLDAIKNYIKRADEIINWLNGACVNEDISFNKGQE